MHRFDDNASVNAGATVDVNAVTRLLHVHRAIVVWDYAAAAPHLPIGMSLHFYVI